MASAADIRRACTAEDNHGLIETAIASSTLEIDEFFVDLLERKCFKCLEIFLAHKKLTNPLLFYCLEDLPHLPLRHVEYLVDTAPECLKVSNETGVFPVHKAIEKAKVEVFRLLLDKDKSVLTLKTAYGESLLDYAIKFENVDITRLLIRDHFGAFPYKWLAYRRACEWPGCPSDVIAALIKGIETKNLGECLDQAIEFDRLDAVKMILARDETLLNRALNMLQFTPLHLCAIMKRLQLIDYILDAFGSVVDLTLESIQGETAFQVALSQDLPLEVVHKFLAIDPEAARRPSRKTGNTGLHCAARGKSVRLVRFLVEQCGLDPREENIDGDNAFFHLYYKSLYLPMEDDVKEIIEILVPRTFGVDSLDRYGFDCLFNAYHFAIRADFRFLFDFFTATFYGPSVNSRHAVIARYAATFDLDAHSDAAARARTVCLFLHDRVDLDEPATMQSAIADETADEVTLVLQQLHREAFLSDDALETFYWLLEELRRHPRLFHALQIWDYYLPPRAFQNADTARRMFGVLTRVFRRYRTNLNTCVAAILNFYLITAKNPRKLNVIRSGCFPVLYAFTTGVPWPQEGCFGYWNPAVAVRGEYETIRLFLPKKVHNELATQSEILPLLHLSRLAVRERLDSVVGGDLQRFLAAIEALDVPKVMKRYLRFLDGFA